jgi:hypothetical protein
MTNISDLPMELQAPQSKLNSLHKPHVPYKRDTVGDSESALDGMTFSETGITLFLAAILPWWADIILDDGAGGDEGWQDYFVAAGLSAVGVTWALCANTDMGFWQSFGLGMASAALSLFLVFIFHLATHKCVSMVVYNRLFRRSWMKKMRETDEALYQSDVATYPERLASYETEFSSAMLDAQQALASYTIANPQGRAYTIEDGRFLKVSKKDELIKDIAEGAKGLFNKFARRSTTV